MPVDSRGDLDGLRVQATQVNAQIAAIQGQMTTASAQLAAIGGQIAAAQVRRDMATVARLMPQQAAAAQALNTAGQAFAQAQTRLGDLLNQMRAFDPCDCGVESPLLLLPVRLETRFATVPGADATLKIRIFPDIAHIDGLRRQLTDTERAYGQAYWQAVWSVADPAPAWSALRAAVGRSRADWVAEATRPTNAASAPAGAPAFAPPPPVVRESVIARLLPDRFVAVAKIGDAEFRATGNVIAGNPEMGIFLPDEIEADLTTVNGVSVSKNATWIADYAAAEAKGLAIGLKVPAGKTIDSLFVFGVRRSLDATQSAAELETLLRAHRFADGIGFVAQGTPSNNLDDARAGWSDRSDAPPPVAAGVAAAKGAALANALGIDPAVFAGASGDADGEEALARAANLVLWEPSWGFFLETIERHDEQDRVTHIGNGDRERARRLHRDLVRGRGPLPTLRIGNQPYGVLPVGTTGSIWRETDPFYAKLMPLLRNARGLWRDMTAKLPRIVPGKGSSDDALLEIFGMSAVSFGARVREALGTEMGKSFGAITGDVDTEAELTLLLNSLMAPPPSGLIYVHPVAALGESRPLALPYVDKSDADALKALVATGKIEIKSVLQALAQLAWSKVKGRTDRLGSADLVATALAGVQGVDASVAGNALSTARGLDTASASKLFAAADQFAGAASDTMTVADYATDANATSFTRLASVSTTAAGRAEFGRAAVPEWFIGQGIRKEVSDALLLLAQAPIEARRIAVAEAIDLASHRVDAWLTAIVEARRRAKRGTTPKGLHVGAFGWVEGIAPGQLDDRNGFIHAPSLAQAATAGVLRSAYLAHNAPNDPAADGAFAIDLTSARVRDAMDLLDSVREGQGLASALGYRIERGLHEKVLDRFILNLRAMAPLSAGQVVDHNVAVPPDVASHLARANVVDGVALIEKTKAAGALKAALSVAPADNPYFSGAWTVSDAEVAQVQAVIAAAAGSLDAVSDLLTAEAVHHLIQGNMPRAAAAIDAAGSGDSPAPVPTFVETPATGPQVSHRIALLIGKAPGWGPLTPRSLAEPRLEAWAAARLGTADTIVAAIVGGSERTLAQTGLAALDFVYLSADPAFLAREIRRRLQLAPDTPLLDKRPAGWARTKRAVGDAMTAAAGLRTVLAGAAPGLPGDFAIPFATPRRAVLDAAIEAGFGRVDLSRGSLQARRDALKLAATPAMIETALAGVADFGIIPPSGGSDAIVQLAIEECEQRLAQLAPIQAGPHGPGTLAKAATILFGDGFVILPLIGPVAGAAADEFDAALATQATLALPSAVRRWVADSGAVRAQVARYGDSLLLADALGITPKLGALQLAGKELVPPATWIGSGKADGVVSSFVVETLGWDDHEQAFGALIVDQFVERLAGDDLLTSGIAFNAPAPNARPAQAWLLAIAPDEARWTTETVLATLRDTLELAKLRGVTLERQHPVARALPALYEQSWSLQGEDVIDWTKLTSVFAVDNPMRYTKES